MAARIGRKITFTLNGVAADGAREFGVSFDGEAIDVTDGASNGWREVLAEAGQHQVDISIGGVSKSDAFKALWFDVTNRVKPVTITYPNGAIISGDFFLGKLSETEPYNEATTFEATIQSTGVVAFTPGA